MSGFDDPGLRALVAQAAVEVAWLGADGGPPRARARVGTGVVCDLGVDQPWAVMAWWPAGAPAADLTAAVAWCEAHARWHSCGMTCSRADVAALANAGLVEREALPVLALPASAAGRLDVPPPADVRIDVNPGYDDVVAGYGGWMQDPTLAAALVRVDDMQRPWRRFVVAHTPAGVAGCALVWLTADSVAVSGLGVVPRQQGRGIGSALVSAASRLGLRQHVSARVVWMHATEAGAAVYQRLGFHQIDEHVTFRAPA